jgi:F0F1-type ATP synthase delta subunit
MKNAYVKALASSILAAVPVEEVLTNTKTLLVKRGHMRLWSQILRAAKRELEVKIKQRAPQVAVTKAGQAEDETIKSALATLGAEAEAYTTTIDETLIGGFTARFGGSMIDASYKRALVNLYQKITK